jgi:hypothetical protein
MAGNGVDSARSEESADPAIGVPFHLDPAPVEPGSARRRPGRAPAAVKPIVVHALLGYLIVLDLALATWALVLPGTWFAVMYGLPYDDPAGLLRRTGAVWVAFLLLQGIALVRWRRAPYWLALIAGVRLTELFSDLTTLAVARQVTWFAWATLPAATISNLVFGMVLIRWYRQLQPGPSTAGHN